MAIDLTAMDETGSLLIPAYGLTRSAHVAQAELEREFPVDREHYALLGRDEWYLQPRWKNDNILSQASAVFNDDIRPYGRRRVVRLRETSEKMPRDTRNTCLMVQGTRTCVRKKGVHNQVVLGYAAWEATSIDNRHNWLSHRIWSDQECGLLLNKTVMFGRSGRGALYAPIGRGKARILLIDFRIIDSNTNYPDIMIFWATCTEVKDGEMPSMDPHNVRLNNRWRDLIIRTAREYRAEHGL